MRHRTITHVFSILLLLLTVSAFAVEFSGEVVAISDGDTISVMHEGKPEKIRLHGVDCPESHQAFGTKAKEFTAEQCFRKTVRVVVKDKDRYGRTVGEVHLPNGKMLNQELVRAGFAWWYEQYAPKDKVLRRYQYEAILGKKGLWADPAPMAPWDFRAAGEKSSESEGASYTEPGNLSPVPKATAAVPRTHAPEGQPGQAPSQASKEAGTPGQVYVTNTGSKYHRGNCRYLSESKIPLSLGDATARGYTPCKVCKPPIPPGASPAPRYTPQPSHTTAPKSSLSPGGETVYITNTGGKYHRAGCRYLSKSMIPISKTDAQTRGYGPCKVCNPGR